MEQQSDVVPTSKFKPSKPSLAMLQRQRQQQENVLDDWDAESSDDEASRDPFQQTKQEWTRANEQARSTMPIVMPNTRSLPSSAFGHGLVHTPQSNARVPRRNDLTNAASAPAPPRILQRPKDIAPGSRSDGSRSVQASSTQDIQTVEQRQEQYRQARARIFEHTDSANSSEASVGKKKAVKGRKK